MNTAFDDELFRYAENLGFGDLHFKFDKATGLQAIIAIHSTKRGPALGGCRFIEYPSVADGVRDALRLARGMSYKAAMANLPLGGGKAVLLKPKQPIDREAYFTAFGRFVDELGGRYITAMDSGTEITDMDVIAQSTPYVTTISSHNGDPAPFTALGTECGLLAAVKFKLGRDSVEGLHIAIQGVGHVGLLLAKLLHAKGARLTVCDRNDAVVQRCVTEYGATAVSPDEIYRVPCDVFAPCALGAILNDQTIPQLQTTVVAGAANNQLAEPRHGEMLLERGILYAPDYVINAGGLIHAYAEYNNISTAGIEEQISQIYATMMTIFARAQQEQKPTYVIADIIAAERL